MTQLTRHAQIYPKHWAGVAIQWASGRLPTRIIFLIKGSHGNEYEEYGFLSSEEHIASIFRIEIKTGWDSRRSKRQVGLFPGSLFGFLFDTDRRYILPKRRAVT
jgi:hypothetical protein